MYMPASKIKDKNLAEVQIDQGWDEEKVDWADVIIIQRPAEAIGIEAFAKARAMGKKVIYEIDDLLWGMDPRNTAAPVWSPHGKNLPIALDLMRHATAITTTTARLANEYQRFNPHIHLLPNYLDGQLWDEPTSWEPEDHKVLEKRKNDPIVRIGFTGSYSHRQDLEYISPVISDIIDDYPGVQFVFMGFDPRDFFAKMQYRACPHCNAEPPIKWVRGVDLLQYPDKLRKQGFDIGIAPLVEVGFNECKSDLKLKEYGALGIPTVASAIKPYSKSMQDGETGFLASNANEWYEALSKLIEDEKLRKEMGSKSHKWYEANRIDEHIHEWIEVYQKILYVKRSW